MKRKTVRRSAFTLAELIVVILLLVLLFYGVSCLRSGDEPKSTSVVLKPDPPASPAIDKSMIPNTVPSGEAFDPERYGPTPTPGGSFGSKTPRSDEGTPSSGLKPFPPASSPAPALPSIPAPTPIPVTYDAIDGWYHHVKDEHALAPSWFKDATKQRSLIPWLPMMNSAPLFRACALTLALLIVYFLAMSVVEYPGTVAVGSAENTEDWFGQLMYRALRVFLLLPVVLYGLSYVMYWLLALLSIAFVSEDSYVPLQFAAFLTVVMSMLGLIVIRFGPLMKMLRSKRMILVQLGTLGVLIEILGVGYTLRDIIMTIIGAVG